MKRAALFAVTELNDVSWQFIKRLFFQMLENPWWMSLLLSNVTSRTSRVSAGVCMCMYSLPGHLSVVFELCSGPLCSHSNLCFFLFFFSSWAHYVSVTCDAASRLVVWANCRQYLLTGMPFMRGLDNICLFCKTQQLQVDLLCVRFFFSPIAGKHFNAYAHVDRPLSCIPFFFFFF